MDAKKQLFGKLIEMTQGQAPICLCADCSDNQTQVVALRSGDAEWQSVDLADISIDKLCSWFSGRGFDLLIQPMMVNGYKYWLFCHVDDMSSRAINVQRLRDASASHDQTTIKAPASKDLFDLLAGADDECLQITLLVQIGYDNRSYTVTKVRYQGNFAMYVLSPPIRLTQAIFDSTLRSAGWSMIGVPSHQKGMNRINGQMVANEYHYILQRGSAAGVVNQLNKNTDLQEWQEQKDRLARIGTALRQEEVSAQNIFAGLPINMQKAIVENGGTDHAN